MNPIIVFFNLLLELDYHIDKINIYVNVQKYLLELYLKDLEYVKTLFYERVGFKNILYEPSQFNLVLASINEPVKNSIDFHDEYVRVQIDIKYYLSITFPPNTTIIKVELVYEFRKENAFSTNNLPKNLKCFSIKTNIPIDLSNSPI